MSLERPVFNLLEKGGAGRLYHSVPRDAVKAGLKYLQADNLSLAEKARNKQPISGPGDEERRVALFYPDTAAQLTDKAGIGTLFHSLGFEAAPRGLVIPINADTTRASIAEQVGRLEGITGKSGEEAQWHIKPVDAKQGRGARPVTGHTKLVQELLAEQTSQAAASIEQQKPFENYVLQERIPFYGPLPEIQGFHELTGKRVNPRVRALRLITTGEDGLERTHVAAWHYSGNSLTPADFANRKWGRHYDRYQPLHIPYHRNLHNEVVPVTTNPDFERMIHQAINTLGERLSVHFGQEMPFLSFDAAITPEGFKALQDGDMDAFIQRGFAPWELQPMPGWAGILHDPRTGTSSNEFRSVMKMLRAVAYGSMRK